jgi:hypothetical protein
MMATLVAGRQLLETVVASVVAGVGITFAFSIAIWGIGRFAEMSRNERPVAAGAAAVTASLALTCVAAAVVIGILAMAKK